jgi:predicted aspartyl protease
MARGKMPRKMLSFLFIIILAGFLKLSAQVPGFYMKEESRKKELPFINSNNLVIIPVSINNGPPVNFLLDTGVKTNILFSKTFGDFLNLNYTRKLDLVGADGQTVLTASVSPTNEIDMGELKGVFQTLLVLDEDFLELERVIGIPVFGVIGYEFFKYNPVKINFDEGIITFYKRDAMKWRPLGFKKLPIKLENSKPYLNAKIRLTSENELIAKLLIDTGANHGLLLNRETSDQIVLPEKHLETDLGRSLGGDLYGFVGRVRSFNLNSFKFNNVITSFPDETEFSYVIKDSGRQGSLGSEILGRMNIVYDYTRERIFLRRGLTFYEPFEFDMSGITPRVIPSDEVRIYVSQVRKNSPAFNAGVRDGDEFVSINGIPLDFWELSDLIKIFRSEEGREIKLTMKRYTDEKLEDFELNEFTFKLKRQI